MAIKDIKFQSLETNDVKEELQTLAPQLETSPPRLWIATDLFGPAWLENVYLDYDRLLVTARRLERIENQNKILFKIQRTLGVAQDLSWRVHTEFQIPTIKAWLQINNHVFEAGSKRNLMAGKGWSHSVEIRPYHLNS